MLNQANPNHLAIPCTLPAPGQENEPLLCCLGFSQRSLIYPKATSASQGMLWPSPSGLLSARHPDLAVCESLLLVYAVSRSLYSANGLENTWWKYIILSVCTDGAVHLSLIPKYPLLAAVRDRISS